MVFGRHAAGKMPPHLDDEGRPIDPNMVSPYNYGPTSQPYISDPDHPDYDPAVDPNLQLRTVRTAAASIAESHRSEARREARRKRERSQSILRRFGRGRSTRKREAAARTSAIQEASSYGALGTGGEGVGVPFDSAQQDKTPALAAAGPDAGRRAQQEALQEFAVTGEREYDSDEEDTTQRQEAQQQQQSQSVEAGSALRRRRKKPPKRRRVYLNLPLAPSETRKNTSDPTVRYARNKVRTSKYTIVTFLPRFLFEQFYRIANIYFLGLVVLQVFPTFGATVPQIAMLPLVSILTITAIKDAIEDHRRHVLDNEVNNAAVTKLGNWRNVNQPRDPRSTFEKILGLAGGRSGSSGKVSRGVRKLREKEDAIGMHAVGGSAAAAQKRTAGGGAQAQYRYDSGDTTEVLAGGGQQGGQNRARTESFSTTGDRLDTIVSESEHGAGTTQFGGSNFAVNAMTRNNSYNPSVNPSTIPDNSVVDYRRHTTGMGRWERTLWKKLEVGDIVLLREDEQVPADIVILNTSDPDGNAYIETKNLDGETNLKVRKALKATTGIQSEEDVEHAQFVIDSEPPHANLYSYNGVLKYSIGLPSSNSGISAMSSQGGKQPFSGTNPSLTSDSYSYAYSDKPAAPDSSAAAADQKQSSRMEPITINELLLRGSALRNTEWVIGLVLFTGEDTKIMLNSGDTPTKRSKIEQETNFNVLMNFFILMIMCAVCTVFGGFELSKTDNSKYFFENGVEVSTSNVINALVILGSCLVVFQNIVPISLYISIEIVKTIQAFFIFSDIEMYYEPLDYPCVPKTWNISDDLGQIEYIFSDKTGTLTQNVMEFKKCSINGVPYGEGITEAMVGAMKREGKDTSGLDPNTQAAQLERAKNSMIDTLNRSFKNRYLRKDKLTLISPSLAEQVLPQNSPESQERRKEVATFFRALALCHTALSDRPTDDPYVLDYKAQSPDEAALVSAARDMGAVFIAKTNHVIDIEVMGQPEQYSPLRVLEFNSTRKRMSVIVRDRDGRILMICKGADSVIYARLREDHPKELMESTQRDLEDFANAGLRTLCIAYRYLDEEEFRDWARVYDAAATSLTDRDDAIDAACEGIEVNLTLLGATALEDKLQAGVPEAIQLLHEAGIKLWILTGDKLQTAIEIGFSCNLLSSSMEIMIISADHEHGTRVQIEAACNKIAAAGRPVLIEDESKGFRKNKRVSRLGIEPTADAPSGGFAVVIDGETLRYALSPALKPLFLALTTQCETVVCCRVSPAQKALTVKLVKDGKKAMTLAIGDGANDVAMIQEAHCGVGIAGLEGAQASMSADYAIGQFRFLTKLLLVHGHWSYVRIADMHKVFFYKNIIWTFTMFWFQLFCNFNATYLYDYSYVLLFNLAFTSLPVIILGALDQDVNPAAIMANPSTYKRGIQGLEYTRALFWSAVVDAIYQSAVCFFVPWAIWNYYPIYSGTGHQLGGIWLFGTTVGAAAVIAANLYAGLAVRFWTWIFWAIEAISILSYFVWALVYSAFPTFLYDDTAYFLFSTLTFWVTIVMVVLLCLLPRYFCKAWRICFSPTEVDLVREQWIRGDLKQRLGLQHKRGTSAKLADLERHLGPGMSTAPSQEGLRQHGPSYGSPLQDDRASETSVDPLPVNDYDRHYRTLSIASPPRPPSQASGVPNEFKPSGSQPNEAQEQSYQYQGQQRIPFSAAQGPPMITTMISDYDETLMPETSTGQQAGREWNDPQSAGRYQDRNSLTASSAGQHAGGGPNIPAIYVQPASLHSHDHSWRDSNVDRRAGSGEASTSYDDRNDNQKPVSPLQSYGKFGDGATSTTALARASTDSFDRAFDDAFGSQMQGHAAPISPSRSPGAAFHDRFRNANNATPQTNNFAAYGQQQQYQQSEYADAPRQDAASTPRQNQFQELQFHEGVPLQRHGQESSGVSDVSFHSAHSQ
ncbi:phospholipid transporting ATPase [Tilletia horrida]|uniref:P-type phospholipid transporter n=1 Tax=Tilletia horrida TaxID=155126 RepID=A0AAN6GTG2_9BASI|nr:phospholipid transporting ATPase [Tilletia horrida]KAK0563895.1 phospholipid transporting ATPase [Tilletia horrida]